MLTSFWEAVGGKLADRWAAVSGPALVFWLGGLAAWVYGRDGLHTLARQARWLNQQATVTQVAAVVTALLVVVASGTLVGTLNEPVLRLLEGYWPTWVRPLSQLLSNWLARRAAKEAPGWQAAYDHVRPPAIPTSAQLATYTRLERRRRRRPSAAGYFLPTPIGNILRAAERRPVDKYGLDSVILWPRLWPALPDNTRQDLLGARASLDNAVAVIIWGILFIAFAPFTLLAIPVGLVVALVAVSTVIPARAQVFGDLIEAAYDQHRTVLYQQLRWPLPASPRDEPALGRRLTSYLWRGSADGALTFTAPPDDP